MEKKKNIFLFFVLTIFISFGDLGVHAQSKPAPSVTASLPSSGSGTKPSSSFPAAANGPTPPTTPPSNGTTATTPSSNGTTSAPTTTTPKPTTAPPNTTTTTTTITPSTSTITPITPSTSTTTMPPPTTVTPPKPDRSFDLPSFVGGIILALGILAIGYVVYKFYRARTDPNYRTL